MSHADGDRANRYVLAVDLGTSAVKVGVVSLEAKVAWADQTTLETQRSPGGAATQDAAQWWRIIREHARRGVLEVGSDRVVAVSCTSQWGSTVPVDEAGTPTAPCLLWQDTRGARYTRAIVGGPFAGYALRPALTWIRRTAGLPSPHGGDPVAHMLFLDRDCSEVAAASRWYLEPCDFLTMCFTGRAAATQGSMIAAWLTDNRRLDRVDYDTRLVGMAGVDAAKLAPLVKTGSVAGFVQAEVARDIGLRDNVQVVMGTPDLHSAVLGTGAVGEYEAHMGLGTTSWISLPMARKKTDARHSIATVPGIGDGRYLVANDQEAAGLCLRWLRERSFGSCSGGDDAPSYEELIALAAQAEAGSNGVIFTPWLAGERSPVDDRNARGGWHNISVATTRADMVRAVLEGVAYNSRWLHRAVERFAGRRVDDIRVFGAGVQSDLWCQIHADVLDRTIERVTHPTDTNLRGAALFAAVALGAVRAGEIRNLARIDRRFVPDATTQAIYERQYAEFPGLYRAQRKMFKRLNGAH